MEKKLAIETVRVDREHPGADVQVWADEHPLGLKPVVRKVWVCPLGNNQMLLSTGGLSHYGFMAQVHPQSGETYWSILPYVRIDIFNRVLADFAEHFGLGEHKRVILVCDLLRNANAQDGIPVHK